MNGLAILLIVLVIIGIVMLSLGIYFKVKKAKESTRYRDAAYALMIIGSIMTAVSILVYVGIVAQKRGALLAAPSAAQMGAPRSYLNMSPSANLY